MGFFVVAVLIVTLSLIPGVALYRLLSPNIPCSERSLPPYRTKVEKSSRPTRIATAVVLLGVAYAFMGFVSLSLFGVREVATWGFLGLAAAMAVIWLSWGRKYS